MTEARIEIRMSNQEKEQLRIEADKCDYQCEDEEQMNVQFFMSLNNFNDRIWDDK